MAIFTDHQPHVKTYNKFVQHGLDRASVRGIGENQDLWELVLEALRKSQGTLELVWVNSHACTTLDMNIALAPLV